MNAPADLGLLLERLEPGTRVRAAMAISYITDDFEIDEGLEGTVVQPWGVGASYVRWDVVLGETFFTSNDALALVTR